MCIYKMYIILFKKHFLKISVFMLFVMFILTLFRPSHDYDALEDTIMDVMVDQPRNIQHEEVIAKYFRERQDWTTSKLGSMLFKYDELTDMEELTQKNKTFIVLVWKYWAQHTLQDCAAWEGQRRVLTAVVGKDLSLLDWTTSKLGSMLFKYDELTDMEELTQKNKTFIVLVWKYWDWLKNRHVYNYGSSNKNDPLTKCRVNNCIFSGDNRLLETADGVVVHMQHGYFPKVNKRNPKQRWIFLNDESPKNAFSLSNKKRIFFDDLANVFNWSMCYRSDSDIPVPYGRTVALDKPIFSTIKKSDIFNIIPNWQNKRRDVRVTTLISNCIKFRMDFIKELQKYIPIDVYGKCSDNKTNRKRCPGHFKSDCKPISQYLFYLVMENSSCREYISEKVWYHAFAKGAIPIIIGPYRQDCKNLLPPNSFIHIEKSSISNTTIKDIATKIIHASQNEEYIYALHSWRNNFAILNEHGYFGTKSYHLCRVCEALNFNDENEKVYSKRDLESFLDPKYACMT